MNHLELYDDLARTVWKVRSRRLEGEVPRSVNALEWLQMVNPERTMQDIQHLLKRPMGRGFSFRRVRHLYDVQSMYATLEALRRIADGEVHTDRHYGICQMVDDQLADGTIWFYRDFKAWPKYSGDPRYPVPGGREGYYYAQDERKLWDESTQQGKDRWELLQFLIERYQSKIEAYEKRK